MYRLLLPAVILACLSWFVPGPGHAQSQSATQPAIASKSEVASIEQLIKSLVNRNAPPRILGTIPSQSALFPEDYDWDEQERIVKAVAKLAQNMDAAWPIVARHLPDDEYCITLEYDQSVSNHTVGEICRILLRATLVAAHEPHIAHTQLAFSHLGHPRLRSPMQERDWWRDQIKRDRSLFEMQIETTEVAIQRIDSVADVSAREKSRMQTDFQQVVKNLRQSKTPVLLETIFMGDSRAPFDKVRADFIRESRSKSADAAD